MNPTVELHKAVDGAARELFVMGDIGPDPNLRARAWTLRAFLRELVAPPVPERYPLCPTCNGSGAYEWVSATASGEPMDWDIEDCPSCGGVGELAPPYGWPVDGARCHACGGELVSPQRDPQMAGWCEGCQNWGEQA